MHLVVDVVSIPFCGLFHPLLFTSPQILQGAKGAKVCKRVQKCAKVCKGVQRCSKVCKSVQDGSKVPHKKKETVDGRIWRLSLLLVQCIHAAQVTHRCCIMLLCARLPVEMPMNSLDALHPCLCWLLNLSYYQPAGIAPQGCKTMH